MWRSWTATRSATSVTSSCVSARAGEARAQVGDARQARRLAAQFGGQRDLVHGAHAGNAAAHARRHADLGGGLVAGAVAAHEHALREPHARDARRLEQRGAQRGRVVIAHRAAAGARHQLGGREEPALADEVQVPRRQHHVAGRERVVNRPHRVGEDHRARAERVQHAHAEREAVERVALVAVAAPGERGHVRAAPGADGDTARVPRHGGGGPVRHVAGRDHHGVLDRVDHAAQARAQRERHRGRVRRAPAEVGDGVRDAAVQVGAGQRRRVAQLVLRVVRHADRRAGATARPMKPASASMVTT